MEVSPSQLEKTTKTPHQWHTFIQKMLKIKSSLDGLPSEIIEAKKILTITFS